MQWEFKESIHCQLFAEHKNTWKSINSTLYNASGTSCDWGTGKQRRVLLSAGAGGYGRFILWGVQVVIHVEISVGVELHLIFCNSEE